MVKNIKKEISRYVHFEYIKMPLKNMTFYEMPLKNMAFHKNAIL
jgi:hypothetical protein